MTQAILYSRFSSAQQAEGDSLRRQTERAELFCSQHGLELSEITYADLGISGWKQVQRDGLESLLRAIDTGAIPSDSFILVEAADRLSRRGFIHILELVTKLVNSGCSLVTIENGQIYNKTNIHSLATALPLIISADLAQQESQRKSERVRAAKTAKRNQRVIQGNQPFWIDIKDGVPVLNNKASLARRIVDLSLSGKRPLAIVREFNTERLESPNGGIWQVAVIRSILKNTILYGAKTYFESRDGEYKAVETVAGLYPKICTKQEFDIIKTGSGEKGRKAKGPFSTLLRCSCGRPLVIKGRRGNDTYRVCGGSIDGVCDLKGYYKNIDEILLGLVAYIEVPNDKPVQINNDDRISELEQRLIDLDAMRKENKGKTRILQMVFEEIEEVENELEELNKEEVIDQTEVDLKTILDVEDSDNQNAILKRIIKKIECKKDGYQTHVHIVFKTRFQRKFIIDQSRKLKGGYEIKKVGVGDERLKQELAQFGEVEDDI
ncbi:TPA: recombinase family protein [Aeromonas dhakensis]|uniref:recombinase family protein n=1 Tax=Aeromonas dhakensis TaxID=196024 RepID=UPI00288CD746|nr:recombinase family protein [Aeromonas dhakensis]HDX8469001.1 recombinase family protein [Aeromonas dhakensis]HDZ8869516.1 recombinase family protein [Aeromonas dhakensis]HDZ8931136.1 recombinase family protein [Aeromonas dhakensis]HEA3208342.1 recombinase family protein [Aeromonas dhakensis]